MKHAWVRWVMYGVALLALGPVAGLLTGSLRAADGSSHATLLVSNSPIKGLAAGVAVFVMAGVLGAATARLVSGRAGMIAAGLVVAWAAWRTGEADDIVRRAQSAAPLWSFAAEAALVGVATLLVVALVVLTAQREHHAEGPTAASALSSPSTSAATSKPGSAERKSGFGTLLPGPGGIAALLAGTALAAAAAWFVGVEPVKGQMIAAAIVAGLIAGTVARLADASSPVTVPVMAICILGIAGPAVGAIMHGDRVVAAMYAGSVLPLARGVPLDWAAGALIGTPLGLAWAGSLMEKRADRA